VMHRIALECVPLCLDREALLQTRHDLVLDDLDQPGIDDLVDDEEGLPVQAALTQ
jgi:hypothetical protein